MRFESYAQEWEDLILYVALQDVEKGFYIDVGANDPVDLSVTKFFYDRGWNGINIEPLQSKCALLANERQRDINLCVGIDVKRGRKELITGGVLTTFSEDIAEAGGFRDGHKYMKTMLTLSDVYERYCAVKQQIHFCKIDVEGYETNVLKGINTWGTYRPWIFVVEAAKPGTDIPCYEEWEPVLLSNGYILAYKTNINRFYLAEEKEYLLERFGEIEQFVSLNDIVKIKMEAGKFFDTGKD